MKITAVKSYAVHPGWRKNLIFVKVETDEGVHGPLPPFLRRVSDAEVRHSVSPARASSPPRARL